MVPAESILNLDTKPLFLTMSVKTPSAAGLRQMLPKHTNSTEKGLVSAAESAIDDDALITDTDTDPDEKEEMGLSGFRRWVEFRRDGKWVGWRS